MDFLKQAQESKDSFLADLNTLVAAESTKDKEHAAENMPFGPGPRQALDAMLEIAKRDGFEAKDVDGYAGLITYGDGEESVGILGHLDIVPLGDGWTKDPLKVTVEDGYMFGRGVLDDKGPLLAGYYALKLVRDAGIPLKRKVMIIAGCDEESGMECMDYYKEHEEIPTLGFTPDAEFPVIHGEKGNIHISLHSNEDSIIKSFDAGLRPNIVIQKANAIIDADEAKEELFDFYLKTHGLTGTISKEDDGVHLYMEGVPAHGSMPYLGINAGTHLLNFIGQAYGDKLAADYYDMMKDWKGDLVGIMKDGVYMGFLTMNPGVIQKEGDDLHALIDIRYPNDTTPEEVLEGFVSAAEGKDSSITVIMDSAGKPLFVDPNSELVTGLMASYRKYTGDDFTPAITIGGGTYAKKFDNFVAFGPEIIGEKKTTDAFVGGCHQRDEGVKVDNMLQAIAIYADAIVNLAS